MRAFPLSVALASLLGLLCVGLLAAGPAPGAGGEGPVVPLALFEIQGGGALFHLEGGASAGQKAFKTKMNTASIGSCIQGDFGCSSHLDPEEVSAEGKAYLFVLDETTWAIATGSDLATAAATQLTGLMDGKGRFMFAGRHLASGTDLLVEGKAALAKGTLLPVKLSGQLRAVSTLAEHWSVGSFKTVASLPVVN